MAELNALNTYIGAKKHLASSNCQHISILLFTRGKLPIKIWKSYRHSRADPHFLPDGTCTETLLRFQSFSTDDLRMIRHGNGIEITKVRNCCVGPEL